MAKPENKVNESEASATLKPTAQGGDAAQSRTAMLASIIGAFAKVEKSDEVAFFDKVMSQFPLPEAGAGSAESNKSSIKMHGEELQQIIAGDVKSIFEGTELSEEFKTRATVLFEAAVAARVIAEVEKEKVRLEEEANAQLETLTEDLVKKIDEYLVYATEEWMKSNEVAIESSLKSDLTEEFIEGLRKLFAEHYIQIPDEQADVVEELSGRIDDLEKQLDEQISKAKALSDEKTSSEKEKVIAAVAEGLALTETEKLKKLVEGVEFKGADDYKTKVTIVKEQHFKKGVQTQKVITEVTDDGVENPAEPGKETPAMSPTIQRYFNAISQHVARGK